MIALFDEPVRVTFTSEAVGVGRVGLLMGMVDRDPRALGLVVLEDGSLSFVDARYFTVDWRYDAEKDRWASVDATETAQS